MLSQAALQAVLSQSTDLAFLECLTIEHESLSTPLRFVNDKKDVTRASGTFTTFPFTVTGMSQSDSSPPSLQITIDNVDQRVLLVLRSLAGTRTDISVTYEVVSDLSPNSIEFGPIKFRVKNVNVTPAALTLDLVFHADFLSKAFPYRLVTPSVVNG